jgi:hypothetical protein
MGADDASRGVVTLRGGLATLQKKGSVTASSLTAAVVSHTLVTL